MANLNIKIMESNDEIKKQINAALADQVNKRLAKSIRKIETAIIPVVRGALMSSPEIASLKGGVLQAEFGLQSDPTSQIVSAITESLNITFQKVNKNLAQYEKIKQR